MAEEKEKKSWYKRWYVWVLAVVVIVGISQTGKKGEDAPSSSSSTNATASAAEKRQEIPTIKVSATDLYAEYMANEVTANDRYEDKMLEITGEVRNVDQTLGSYYAHLKGDGFGSVSCKLEDKSDAASLSAGQTITFIGKGDGKLGFPRVTDCRIKK